MRDDIVATFRHVAALGIERTSAIADRKVVEAAVAMNAKVNMSEKSRFQKKGLAVLSRPSHTASCRADDTAAATRETSV